MKNQFAAPAASSSSPRTKKNTALLLGLAGGIAMFAGWKLSQPRQLHRRFADHGVERRSPLSLFVAGNYPRRRKIDQSGTHPLFERRQSVYEAY